MGSEMCIRDRIYVGNLELDENIINGKLNYHSDENALFNSISLKASGLRGFIYTPRFFEEVDKDRYDNNFRFKYEITVSHMIPKGGTIQMNLTVDTKEYMNQYTFYSDSLKISKNNELYKETILDILTDAWNDEHKWLEFQVQFTTENNEGKLVLNCMTPIRQLIFRKFVEKAKKENNVLTQR